jgi:hypothetical protein
MSDNNIEIVQNADHSLVIETGQSSGNPVEIITSTTTVEISEISSNTITIESNSEQSTTLVLELSSPMSVDILDKSLTDLMVVAGSGISVENDNGVFTVSVTGVFGLDGEQVDDRVSNLLVAGDYISLNYIDNLGTLTVSTTGLQPSGNYSLVGHSHTTNDITNFNSGVSGLLPSVNGSGYVSSVFNNNAYTISVSGLQPSGNYSLVGHTHTSSNITDFNSAVSGLIPPSNFTSLSGVSGILVTSSGTNYTVGLSDPSIQLSDITDLSSDARTFLSSPSSNNLQTLITNETGSGLVVFNNSPVFSGIPTAPTAPSGTNTTQIANTSFVRTEINNLINAAPGTLDTLNELAAALGNDANFAATVASGLSQKANVVHTHLSSDITDFNSSVSGLLPVKNVSGSGYVNVSSSSGNYTVSVSGLQPSGNYSIVGHSHYTTDISDFNSGVSGLLPVKNITGSGYINVASSSGNYTISASGLQPSGNYSVVGHTHSSSDITDFNSSVSGLIPVKDILAGSGISVSSSSGIYTIDANISGVILEVIQDNLGNEFLVAGTGVQLTYNDSSNTLTLDNLHTEINELSFEPQGFVNRHDSIISFNDSTRTFTIAPSGSSYDIYIEGVKVTKTTSESIVIPSGTALNYLHFNTDTGLLDNKTTAFNFDTDVPIAFIHWNGGINQSTFFGEERHGIRMDSMTHKWIHNTFGMQYINGLSIGGYTLLGNGSLDSHAQIDISDGTLYQEDIIINVTNGTGSGSFIQQLSPIAYIPVYYHSGSTGQWVRDVSTPYPLKYNATRALYNLYSGGTWTTPNVPNNRYFAMWIVATNDINDPILAIMGQREDSSLSSAENNNNWGDINLTNIPTNELRPLYRLIFVTNDTFTNTPKSSLQTILDLRASILSTTYGVAQNDHGSLFGLGDDDHTQYVHINEARTISTNHTFSNGLTINNGLLSATSGDFTSLSVNGTGVSLDGHTHISSSITDFNASVSGLLPTVSGTGYVTSSFTNNVYSIGVIGLQPSGNYSIDGHTHLASNITDFNSSVSGLLPVTNIVGGTNISVIPSGSEFTISVSGSLGLTTEEVDDRVSNLLVAGTGIVLDYNDGSNTLTINSTSTGSAADEIEEYAATSNFPASGDLNILYIATDTAQIFKWDGSVYYEAGPQGASTATHGYQHKSDSTDPVPLTEYLVPQFTSNTNNLVHNNKDILYLDADANNRELSGLIAPSFCVAKVLVNISSTNTIILDHQSINSDPSNRFIIYTGADYYLLPGYSVSIVYDTNASRWRVL